jgi:D-lactate dehydrogenase
MAAVTVGQTQGPLADSLAQIIPRERVLTRPIDLIAFASDASFYRLIPQAVVLADGVEEIRHLLALSCQRKIPMTFRAAGTSLSGQAVSDGILVETARYWKAVRVEDGGRKVRIQPGVIGAHVNRVLAPYGAKIGPDPASLNTCMIGGILSNNSSGMCCGVEQNAYHTLESLTFVLPSGNVFDTALPDADARFHQLEPMLAQGVLELKAQIEADPVLNQKIRSKYRMKNTVGYSLNAFQDFDRAMDIFRHLLIGAEGTLAFIAEAVLRTVPDLPVKYTGLLFFPSLHAACAAIEPLRQAGAKALEIMDRAALRSVERQVGVPSSVRSLPPEATGLLAEFQCLEESSRHRLEMVAKEGLEGLELLEPASFTHEVAQQVLLWKMRSGLFPSVGAARRSGTTAIIEDVAFPIPVLADAAVDLTRLFARHGYHEAIIFGHAKDGNLHFVIAQSFNDQFSVDQYARFMDDVVQLVVERYDGALKAEHGTGRNMAPFVETEWGAEAYAIMKRLKELADPAGLLNPGVILNVNPKVHLFHLKSLPAVEEVVDKCIECGYCEPQCPSRNLTLTPRQRIVVRREMERLRRSGQPSRFLVALEADFAYDGLATCAVDGLCAIACPVSINTGDLTRHLRASRHSPFSRRLAVWAAQHFASMEKGVRFGLRAGHTLQHFLGVRGVTVLSRLARVLLRQKLPLWLAPMPLAASPVLPITRRESAYAVYFPSCLTRTLGALPGESAEMSAAEALVTVSRRAGKLMWIPDGAAGHCCGTPFSSKGYVEAHQFMVNRAVESLWEWTDRGRLPVVIDTSVCTHGLKACRSALSVESAARFDRLTIWDSVEFAAEHVLPKVTVRRRERCTVLHPVCSLVEMNLAGKFERIARACSERVVVPPSAGCCAFAGDRGWLFPELTESATRDETAEVRATKADGFYSSSRTCEVALSRATGRVYRSYLFLLEWATRE